MLKYIFKRQQRGVRLMNDNRFYRDTWVEVDIDALQQNLIHMQRHIGEDKKIIAVVKANAYGHGALEVSKAALEVGASMLAVSLLDEAIYLRNHGITAPILILGYVSPQYVMEAIEYDVILTVFTKEWIEEAEEILTDEEKTVSVHLKLDTGMGRLGVKETEELVEIAKLLKDSTSILFDGVFTHFATADELDQQYFKKQLAMFHQFINTLKKIDICPSIIHCANSATAFLHTEELFDAVRLGIGMYGLTPSLEIAPYLPYELKEVLSLHSRLSHVKKIKAGESVSYGATYTAKEDHFVGTVPIGYADGWVRRLNSREVLVNGVRCPIIGRICMDQLMIRLSENVSVNSKVTLIGKQGNEYISTDEVARTLGTINYEVPCSIDYRVPRVYVKNQEIIAVKNCLLEN